MIKTRRKLFRIGNLPTSRIESFSDNVFAFSLTLLVLDIHIPRASGPELNMALVHGLVALIPQFLVYVFSFVLVCLWWVAHHHFFNLMERSDRGLLWLNSLFLLWLSFLPFPTAFMGAYPLERVSVMFYGAVTMMAGISFALMRYYAFYVGKLVNPDLDKHAMKAAMVRSAVNPILHLFAIACALIDPRITLGMYVLFMMMFFIPSRLESHEGKTF